MSNKKTNKKRQQSRRARLKRRASPKLNPNGIDIPFAESLRHYQDLLNEGMFEEEYEADEIVLRMHPDFLEVVRSGRDLPEEITDEDSNVWNPRMHLAMHSAVESQLVRNQPEGIFTLACELESEQRIGSHQIRHAMADVFAGMIWSMQREDKLFDSDLYLKEISERYEVYAG